MLAHPLLCVHGRLPSSWEWITPNPIFHPWLRKRGRGNLHHEWFWSLGKILNVFAVEGAFTLKLYSVN